MEQVSNNKIEIRPTGSYFEVDENSYLKNPASLDKIQEKWKPLVDDVIEVYRNKFGENLHSVYIRGSVAKGEAVDRVSDLDSFAYVNLSKEEIEKGWQREGQVLLKEKYPFAEDIEITVMPVPEKASLMIAQSVCVYGESMEVPPKKPGKDMLNHLYHFEERHANARKWLENISDDEKEQIMSKCTWLMKDILRTGFELTMERSGRYTRDLYLFYKDFSEYYPDKEPLMRHILDLTLNPTSDKQKVLEIRDEIIPWMAEEAKKFI